MMVTKQELIYRQLVTLKDGGRVLLRPLMPEDRQALPKMGEKTVSFVNKSLEYARQNPGVVPAYLDVTEFAKDVNATSAMFKVAAPLRQLLDQVEDTLTTGGSEAYQAALVFYNALKTAVKSGETQYQTMIDDLSQRFPGRLATKKAAQNP